MEARVQAVGAVQVPPSLRRVALRRVSETLPRRFRRKASVYKASVWKRKAVARSYNGWKRITKMCRVFAVVFCQMGLFSARERLGELFSAWKHQASAAECSVFRKRCDDALQVRESLLLEVRLLRDTLRDAQGDIERCRYFSAEMTRREAEITQRAEAKVQQCVLLPASAPA